MSGGFKYLDQEDARVLPDGWGAVFAAASDRQRRAMVAMRALVWDVAAERQVGPLTEALKWGQPSWLTEVSGAGTILRMGVAEGDRVALYVHCQTDLVARYRAQFPEVFTYQGNRAVLIPVARDWPEVPLRAVIGQALTYKRDKKRGARDAD